MKILVFGATGRTGRAVVERLVARGHQVTAFARNPDALPARAGVQVVQGDVLKAEDVEHATRGQEAVVSALGAGASSTTTTLCSQGMRNIVTAMQRHGVRRIVCVSNFGAGTSRRHVPWIFRRVIQPVFLPFLKEIVADKERMEAVLQQSDLEWTAARPPGLTSKAGKGTWRVSLDGSGLSSFLPFDDLAAFLVQSLEDRTYVCQAPSLSS